MLKLIYIYICSFVWIAVAQRRLCKPLTSSVIAGAQRRLWKPPTSSVIAGEQRRLGKPPTSSEIADGTKTLYQSRRANCGSAEMDYCTPGDIYISL